MIKLGVIIEKFKDYYNFYILMITQGNFIYSIILKTLLLDVI